jgi:leucine dehydrogenase
MLVRHYGQAPAAETIRLEDKSVGLDGVIVIHSAVRGPALGGCRLWDYMDVADMLEDASRLAASMSYKNALAGLPLEGAKAVLRLPNQPFDRTALFEAFGRAVHELRGQYVTAPDVGTHGGDMEDVARSTAYVAGLPMRRHAATELAGGDPSSWAADGVFAAIEAGAKATFQADLSGMRVAVQGTGKVGGELCRRLSDAGAQWVIADSAPGRRDRLAAILKARVVPAERILAEDVDIIVPCALGRTLTMGAVEQMKARLICGAANNQLADMDAAHAMHERGIVYVPDYVANAGGVIRVAAEYLGETQADVAARVAQIGPRVSRILADAQAHDLSPAMIADMMAEQAMAEQRRTLQQRKVQNIAPVGGDMVRRVAA